MKPDLKKGQLVKWNDDRGFGFIKPSESSKEVFLHISAIKTTGRRPKVGDTIFYELVTEGNGKIRASGALIQGVVSQCSTLQKTNTAPYKQKGKKRELCATILGIGVLVSLVLVQMQCSPSRSPTPIAPITKPGCVVKGNISIATGAKLYHIPGMEDYDETIIDPGKGERWFCSESEAVAAGWRKAPR
jgi:cold shock CspA family protein